MFNRLAKISLALLPISALILTGCGSTDNESGNKTQMISQQATNRVDHDSLIQNQKMSYTPRVFGKPSPFGKPVEVTAEILNPSAYHKDPISKFGGRLDKQYESTGYFHTLYTDGRWWLIDPEGHPMIHMGLNGVESVGTPENTVKLMKNLGFNSTGAFSKKDVESVIERMPRTPKLRCMESFASAYYGAKSNGNNYDFENKVIAILDPRFESFCFKRLAQSIKSSAVNDPYIIGYYVDNELPWKVDSLDRTLSLSKDNISKEKAEEWLAQNGGVVNDETRRKFLSFSANKYYSIAKRALKKAAPNHLYLGSRLHASYKTNEEIVRAAGKYVDVLSVNFYGPWKPRASHFSKWKKWANKPVIMSEWYTKAKSTGLPNASGAGHVVADHLDRGVYYQDFTISMLKSDNMVGWSWHRFIDQKPGPVGATSNKGFLDKDGVIYRPLVEKAKQLNDQVYTIIDHFKS